VAVTKSLAENQGYNPDGDRPEQMEVAEGRNNPEAKSDYSGMAKLLPDWKFQESTREVRLVCIFSTQEVPAISEDEKAGISGVV
jgi:hypothetical protein